MGSFAQYHLVISWELLRECYLRWIYSYYDINVNFKVIVFNCTFREQCNEQQQNDVLLLSLFSSSSSLTSSLPSLSICSLRIPRDTMVWALSTRVENRVLIFLGFLFCFEFHIPYILHCILVSEYDNDSQVSTDVVTLVQLNIAYSTNVCVGCCYTHTRLNISKRQNNKIGSWNV